MGEAAENLNYDFNYNMFLAKIMLSNLPRSEGNKKSVVDVGYEWFYVSDRQNAVKWMKKLTTCNRTIEEMKLRNDFMYYLVINIQQGELQTPFTDNPPTSPLPNIANLLVSFSLRIIIWTRHIKWSRKNQCMEFYYFWTTLLSWIQITNSVEIFNPFFNWRNNLARYRYPISQAKIK